MQVRLAPKQTRRPWVQVHGIPLYMAAPWMLMAPM